MRVQVQPSLWVQSAFASIRDWLTSSGGGCIQRHGTLRGSAGPEKLKLPSSQSPLGTKMLTGTLWPTGTVPLEGVKVTSGKLLLALADQSRSPRALLSDLSMAVQFQPSSD